MVTKTSWLGGRVLRVPTETLASRGYAGGSPSRKVRLRAWLQGRAVVYTARSVVVLFPGMVDVMHDSGPV